MSIISWATQSPELGTGYVYKWTNLINGMMYIGSHNGTNPNYIGSGKRFLRAYRKHGAENFVREILYTGPNYYEVETEILVTIDAARSHNMFYNDTNNQKFGGQPVFSPQVLADFSVQRKQYFEDLAAQGILHPFIDAAGEKNGFYGKTHSPTTREVMAISRSLTHHRKGNHPFPRDYCSLCPDVTRNEMVALFKVACIRELSVTPMTAGPLHRAIQGFNYPTSLTRQALTELQAEGLVKKVRGTGYVILDGAS